MTAHIISIGNSKGIRIPKAILEQCGLEDEVVLSVQGKHLLVTSATHPRSNWEEATASMQPNLDREDSEWLAGSLNDETEWQWK
jgi:antitoxin MazE